ncbi:MAG: EamA family transporter RarD [Bdellovibrionales bacterium]|nr:EamA family transporter RarD [Bdellovibrionales bacterium]
MKSKKRDFILVMSAYVAWGLLPMFWALFSGIAPRVVLFHRVLWSMILLAALFFVRGDLHAVFRRLLRLSVIRSLSFSSLFLGLNWYLYVWALGEGKFVSAGLGYFICPLITIGFGALFFQESLTRWQKIALSVVLVGVLAPIFYFHEIPWFALGLAFSWASYTAVKKRSDIPSLESVFGETLVILPLLSLQLLQTGDFGLHLNSSFSNWLLFVMAGAFTVMPQLALVTGVKGVPLKYVGIMQYITPTLMIAVSLIMGVKSPTLSEMLTIAGVWSGILLFFFGRAIEKFIHSQIPSRQVASSKL